MRFVVDAQLPPGVAKWLRERGHDAEHVFDRFPLGVSDTAIWNHAAQSNAVVVTKDQDFATRILLTPKGPAVVWLRVGNTSKTALLAWMTRQWPIVESALQRGDKLVEVT